MTDLKHFLLSNTAESHDYTSTVGGSGKFRIPSRDSREIHGNRLLQELDEAKTLATELEQASTPAMDGLLHLPLTLEGSIEGSEKKKCSGLDLEKLDSDSKGIRIVNVREEDGYQVAIVAIPKDQLDYFEKKFTDYIEKDNNRTKKDGTTTPKNQRLVESISELRLSTLQDYYTDTDKNLPGPNEEIWWEVWLESVETEEQLNEFRQRACAAGLRLSDQSVRFPEVVVVHARGTWMQWSQVQGLFRNLAELRRAKIVASEFMELSPADQAEFIKGLLDRTIYADGNAPAVTLLDTGVNRGHPLLEPALDEKDVHICRDEWYIGDTIGHGTEVAGVVLFGPRLKDLLISDEQLTLPHRLESVKILGDYDADSEADYDAPDYGPTTATAIKKAEDASPSRKRVFCMTITTDGRDQYLPTLWSAAIDQVVSGKEGLYRLLVVSAGNVPHQPGKDYPDSNHLESIQSPAQSWNALTVGAYTELWEIKEKGFEGWVPVAPKGRLSPSSTTSVRWIEGGWPIKPEVVLEGGNYATDTCVNFSDAPDLSILTTAFKRTGATLGLTRATSAAAGQTAGIAAQIQAAYPTYWPETIRGFLVHNARWTKEMENEFPAKRRQKIPASRLRCYGWGVPNLVDCLACERHFATMIIQDTIQPFCFKKDGKKTATKEMRFHRLPIPKERLLEIGDERIEMRLTLSYFIEPSPGRKGWNKNHRYASHALRFAVLRPLEDVNTFQKRISRDFWDIDDDSEKPARPAKGADEDRHWAIGEFGQTKGSLHSDFWIGTASQLAESDAVAIYPVTGWWRERPNQGCLNNTTRYSLIVTIKTHNTEIELYNWVANEIGISVENIISIEPDMEG
jgi:hypothetical protein